MRVLPAELFESDGQQSDTEEELDEDERFQHVASPPGMFGSLVGGCGTSGSGDGGFGIGFGRSTR